MKHFTPTLGFFESGRNVRSFVKDNMDVFWDVLKPLLPYLVGLYLLDLAIVLFGNLSVSIGNFISGYFFAALAITWHRVVLHGPDRYEPMNPLKPQKHELMFMLAGIGLAVLVFVIAVAMGMALSVFGDVGKMVGIFAAFLISVFLWSRFSFYFPAKAVNASFGLKDAYRLSKGYVMKLIFTPILASWRVILLVMVITFVLTFIIGFLVASLGMNPMLSGLLMQIPMLFFFQPLLTVLAITVLSNFYQYAQQHRDGDDLHAVE